MKSAKSLKSMDLSRCDSEVATLSCKNEQKIQQLPFLFQIIQRSRLARCSQLFVSQGYLDRCLKSLSREIEAWKIENIKNAIAACLQV
jgi:hypothetical protein